MTELINESNRAVEDPPFRVAKTGTPFIVMETGEYPIYFPEVRRRHPTIAFPAEPYYHQVVPLGFGVVEWADPPTIDEDVERFEEDAPIPTEEYGVYKRGWKIVPLTAEELDIRLTNAKNYRYSLLNMREEEALVKGFDHTFEDGSSGHIQVRTQDRVNFLGRLYKAEKAKKADQLDALFSWRTAEGELKQLFTEEMISLAILAGDKYEAVLGAKWALEEQVKATTDIKLLPEIPETLI